MGLESFGGSRLRASPSHLQMPLTLLVIVVLCPVVGCITHFVIEYDIIIIKFLCSFFFLANNLEKISEVEC